MIFFYPVGTARCGPLSALPEDQPQGFGGSDVGSGVCAMEDQTVRLVMGVFFSHMHLLFARCMCRYATGLQALRMCRPGFNSDGRPIQSLMGIEDCDGTNMFVELTTKIIFNMTLVVLNSTTTAHFLTIYD